MKYKALNHIRQEKAWIDTTYLNPSSPFKDLSDTEKIRLLREYLTQGQLQALKIVYGYCKSNKKAFPAILTIAREAKVGKDTVEKAIRILHRAGVIYKENRQHYGPDYRPSNRYYIDSNFLTVAIKRFIRRIPLSSDLVGYIKRGIKFFSLALLISATGLAEKQVLFKAQGVKYLTIHPSKRGTYLQGTTMDLDGLIQKEKMYNEAKENRMNPEALALLQNNLHKLPLTMHGMLKMSVFSPQVIQQVLAKPFKFEAQDPFAYLFKVAANEHAEQGGLDLDFKVFNEQVIKHNLKFQPFIDADLLEKLKETHKRDTQKSKAQSIPTREQRDDVLLRQEERWRMDNERQERLKNDKIRNLGFEPEQLRFFHKNQLLKGTITPEQLRLELTSAPQPLNSFLDPVVLANLIKGT